MRALTLQSSCAASRLLHRAQFFGDEGRDVVCSEMAVGESLIECEVWKRETGQGRVVVVARINADGAVRDVDAVTPEASEQWQKRGRRVAEDARLAAILFIKVGVARPQQEMRVRFARVFALLQPGVDVESIIVFVIDRHLPEKFQMLKGDALFDSASRVLKVFVRVDAKMA